MQIRRSPGQFLRNWVYFALIALCGAESLACRTPPGQQPTDDSPGGKAEVPLNIARGLCCGAGMTEVEGVFGRPFAEAPRGDVLELTYGKGSIAGQPIGVHVGISSSRMQLTSVELVFLTEYENDPCAYLEQYETIERSLSTSAAHCCIHGSPPRRLGLALQEVP